MQTDKEVLIEPVAEVLGEDLTEQIRGIEIWPNCCHENAFKYATLCNELGYDVKFVDGYYIPDSELNTHSFCMFEGHYFCPTIEYLFGYETTQSITYIAKRIFEPYEYLVFTCSVDYLENEYVSGNQQYCSTLYDDYNRFEQPSYVNSHCYATIDNDGYLNYEIHPNTSSVAY